ncbi:Bug family tripartite tricarboxylate transporter substrate binding protein [Pseudomonas typographi]|uniref:Bug family tripartite tricarboxylate transporter substrate binding protein n=1 Tax=Pseudomonas typographi TaxID=2715964 RepID=UPI0016890825|nr:tripartite tricarboxylate transporter substrate binding protein [Pseudomonas typographi]MBD1586621.1 tripartite tricarboxylate transporter substrate binding protein [Pseudomonas typographi]
MKLGIWILLSLSALLAIPHVAQADSYPSHPVKIVIPSPPGGTNDIIARLVAERLAAAYGQNFIVENRSGAGGLLAVRNVARAKPDGYTLLLSFAGPLVVNTDPRDTEGLDPAQALAPISILADLPYALVVRSNLPVDTLQELVAYSKSQRQGVNLSINAFGSDAHLLTEQFKRDSGIKAELIPYQGTGPALNDLLGDHIDGFFTSFPAVAGHIKNGQIKPLLVATPERWPGYAQVPTTAEAGIGQVVASAWFGLLAPKGTEANILDSLSEHVAQALQNTDVREALLAQGANARGDSRAQSALFIANERARWDELKKTVNIRQ